MAASSSSSSSLPPRNSDVFLSFSGKDTRKNFTDHLFAALVRQGFCTFRDDEKLERGEEIGIELLRAIEGSRISVIVFSRNYAASRWCLDELVKIMECKSKLQQIVVPVFYNVDPSDVRSQRGSFGEAFARHEERYGGLGMEAKLEKWRKSLTDAANLSGWDLQNVANGHESKFIEKIVEDISNKLDQAYLDVGIYTVGVKVRVQHVILLLNIGSEDVRMVGIWGIGGLGKTTIAKAIYNVMYRKFEGCCFLANVREVSMQPNGLVCLQEQLLSDVLRSEIRNIRNVDQGIEVIKQRLRHKRILLVLDDVTEFDQLKALGLRRDSFHQGSRIIVTTRDESLLKLLEVDELFMPELLNHYESLNLFSWHAFRQDHPREDYVELSKNVVGYAGGLPLALEVLGSFLFDKSMPEWKSALEKLKVIPHNAIQEKLRISFDSLDDEEKAIFLDISCFFVGMDKNYIFKILEGCGVYPEIGIGVLSRRCLVKVDALNQIGMHDLLRDMGREVVRRECLKEPGKRSRLWLDEDVLDVLSNHTGTEAVEGLVLNLPRSNGVQVNAVSFSKMNRLRLLKLNYVHVSGSYEHLSKRLRWLCWYGFPLKSIPSNLFMEKVVAIDMSYSSLKQVWKGTQVLNELKFLNLSHSYHLTGTPDFSSLTNLEKLLLNDCTSLVEVHQSIESLDKLVLLDLKNCKNLQKLPLGLCKLKSLQNFNLSGCAKLENLAGFRGSPSKSGWFSLFSYWTSMVRSPDSISQSPASIQGLISLRRLDLSDCNLSHVPDELGSLISLEFLNLIGNNFCTLPATTRHLSQLKSLYLDRCANLQSLPELPINLEGVNANHCKSLERITIGSNLQRSPFLKFSGCDKLVENILAIDFRTSLIQCQELSALGEFYILLPGAEIPNWFNYQSFRSVLSFVVPPLPDRKIRGWIMCVVYVCCSDEKTHIFSFYHVKNKTKGLEKTFKPVVTTYPLTRQDHLLFLHYAPQYYPELQMESGDEVEYSVYVDGCIFRLKKCGVNLIYEGDENDNLSNDQAMIQCVSPAHEDAILEGDVPDPAQAIGMSLLAEVFRRIKKHQILR